MPERQFPASLPDDGLTPDGVNPRSGFVSGRTNPDAAIRRLTHLNGIPVAELERRMRPNHSEGVGPSLYSYDGFLAQDESLLAVLLADNQAVRRRGYTHQELADFLDLAAGIVGTDGADSHFGVNGMEYSVFFTGTVSAGQRSPFANPDHPEDAESGDWDGSYTIRNLTTGRAVSFAPPLSRWIRQWGFYEGSVSYRVDPDALIDLFTRTDRMFETGDEYAKRQTKSYLQQGWTGVTIGSRRAVYASHPYLRGILEGRWADTSDPEPIVQVIEDKDLVVALLTKHSEFSSFETGFAVLDRFGRRPLIECHLPDRYEVRRTETDGHTRIGVVVRNPVSGAVDAEFSASVVPDPAGWNVIQKGGLEFVGDLRYLLEFGKVSVDTGSDSFELFKSFEAEFMFQRRYGGVMSIYKKDRGHACRKVDLYPEQIRLLLGIAVESGMYVTDLREIAIDEKGVVSGIMEIAGVQFPFRW